MYASSTLSVAVYEVDNSGATATAKGTGDTDSEIDITDVAADGTNFLMISIANINGANIYGGYVTIEAT